MRIFYTLVLSVLFTLSSYGQVIWGDYLSDAEETPCLNDTSQTIYLPNNWEVYQTIDNKWNGLRDTTVCHSFFGWTRELDVSSVDSGDVIFVRYLFEEEEPIPLEANFPYTVDTYVSYNWAVPVANSSKVIIGVEAPDETGDSTNTFVYEYSRLSVNSYNSTCLNTHYLPNQYLKEFIWQLEFDGAAAVGDHIEINRAAIEHQSEEVGTNVEPVIGDVVVNDIDWGDDNIYELDIDHLFGGELASIYLIVHDTAIYPTSNYVSYTDIVLADTTETESVVFDLYLNDVSYGSGIQYAPGTALRGGLVFGSDTLRHELNIYNATDYCLAYIDVNIAERVSFIYQAGDIQFGDARSCFYIKNQGKFVVAEDANMEYGQDEIGMLAFTGGSKLVLERNSTMTINNQLILADHVLSPDNQMYVDLQQGAKLIFGETSSIMKKGIADGYLKFNVYMNGGEIDERHLSAEERLLINKIYPSVSTQLLENVRLLNNPTTHQLSFELLSDAPTQVEWQILDVNGELIRTGKETAVKGKNSYDISVENMANGMYLLNLQTNQGTASLKWIKMR